MHRPSQSASDSTAPARAPFARGDCLTAVAIATAFIGLILAFKPFANPIVRDAATWTYMAIEIATGLVPHRDIFIHKTPGAAILAAAGAWLAPLLGVEPVHGAHAVSILLGAIGPALLFLLCRPRLGYLAALAAAVFMIAIDQWPVAVFEGVRPKVPMVTLGLASLIAASRARPLAAGAFAALSILCWQPAVCFAAGAAWELAQTSSPGTARRRALGYFVAGGVAVAVLFATWLVSVGAFTDFFKQAVLFNFSYVETKAAPPQATIARIWRTLNGWAPLETVLALLAIPLLAFRRPPLPQGVLVAGALYAVLTFASLQAWPDTIPLVPMVAVLAAAGLATIATAPRARTVCAVAVLALAVYAAVHPHNRRLNPSSSLARQAQLYRTKAAALGPTDAIVAISTPEVLIHTGRRSAWKWPYMWNGVDAFAAREAGGFGALLAELEAIDPKLIFLARTWKGPNRHEFTLWAAKRYLRTQFVAFPHSKPISVYTRKDEAD